MTDALHALLDDLFHGCAFAAYVELAAVTGGVPDVEATRRLAFRYYEEALAARGRQRSGPVSSAD